MVALTVVSIAHAALLFWVVLGIVSAIGLALAIVEAVRKS